MKTIILIIAALTAAAAHFSFNPYHPPFHHDFESLPADPFPHPGPPVVVSPPAPAPPINPWHPPYHCYHDCHEVPTPPAPVPEPSTLVMFGVGALMVGLRFGRR